MLKSILFILASVIFCSFLLAFTVNYSIDQVSHVGLKKIVNQIWNGDSK